MGLVTLKRTSATIKNKESAPRKISRERAETPCLKSGGGALS
jgi:hypothetical protein